MNIISENYSEMDDEQLLNNLVNNKYDITKINDKFITYLMFLIEIQIKTFEDIFDGNDISNEVAYCNGDKFMNNENDLLQASNTAKLLYPIYILLAKEIKENRKINIDEFRILLDNCIYEYSDKHKLDNNDN